MSVENDSDLLWFAYTDLAAIVRGRGVPGGAAHGSVGWVPADQAINAFGDLVDNPWGSSGDLRLVPDPATRIRVAVTDPALDLVLTSAVDLEGRPWDACPRGLLNAVLEELEQRHGLRLLAAFEHEFSLVRGASVPAPFSIDAARRAEPLLSTIARALDEAGLEPENVLPEYGDHQIEVTIRPTIGVAAADRAVLVREVIRECARALNEPISFSPVIGTDAGTNGVHVHMSLVDLEGRPCTNDAEGVGKLSRHARRFAAGIAAHMRALVALTAPSVVSYHRLQPHSWSAAYAIMGEQNREAALRIAPVHRLDGDHDDERRNLEFRPVDATASPYLVLAALVRAGMHGLDDALEPPVLVDSDPSELSEDERSSVGIERLPADLGAALDALVADEVLEGMLGDDLRSCYLSMKRHEIERFADSTDEEIVLEYRNAY